MKLSCLLALCLSWASCCVITTAQAAGTEPQPSALNPELLYKDNCSICHGDNGDGNSRASNSLIPPPRNFLVAFDLTHQKMVAAVTNGKPGTAMTSWKSRLTSQQIELVVGYVRGTFIQPSLDKQVSVGRLTYGHNCKSCHGEQGQGILASGLAVAPKSLVAPGAKTELNRERMIAAVTRGVPGTPMSGFSDKLPAQNIAAAVDYIREILMTDDAAPTSASAPVATDQVDMSLPLPKGLVGDVKLGEQFFMGNCATCHGKLGDGQGPRAYFMTAKPRNFLDDYSHVILNRPAIFNAATFGRPGTEMPAWGHVLSEQQIANVAEFVFEAFIQKNGVAENSSGK